MDRKILIFFVLVLLMGSSFGCSGWITNENGTYYNVYDENGSLNQTVYMEGSTNNTNISESNTTDTPMNVDNDRVSLNKYICT